MTQVIPHSFDPCLADKKTTYGHLHALSPHGTFEDEGGSELKVYARKFTLYASPRLSWR